MTTTLRVIAGSIQYLDIPVTLTDDTGAVVNPTSDTVSVAFQPLKSNAALTWQPATWATVTAGGVTVYKARMLLGVAPFVLAVGTYTVYVKTSDNPETPIIPAGSLLDVAAP